MHCRALTLSARRSWVKLKIPRATYTSHLCPSLSCGDRFLWFPVCICNYPARVAKCQDSTSMGLRISASLQSHGSRIQQLDFMLWPCNPPFIFLLFPPSFHFFRKAFASLPWNLLLSFFLLCSVFQELDSANYVPEATLPTGVLLCLTKGRHWQGIGEQKEGRAPSRSLLWVGGSSGSDWAAPPSSFSCW